MKTSLTKIISLLAISWLVVLPAAASAFDPFQQVDCSGDNNTSTVCNSQTGGSGSNAQNPLTGPGGKLEAITSIIAYIAGVAAIIIIIVSAIRFITAGGDSGKAASARSTLTGALIGLAIIVLAKVLIDFVLSKL